MKRVIVAIVAVLVSCTVSMAQSIPLPDLGEIHNGDILFLDSSGNLRALPQQSPNSCYLLDTRTMKYICPESENLLHSVEWAKLQFLVDGEKRYVRVGLRSDGVLMWRDAGKDGEK